MKPIKIFKSQYGYSMGVSQKLQDGTYENGYFPVQFKKGVELDNQTLIIPTDWTITFYTNKDGQKVFKLCVWEFIIHTDVLEKGQVSQVTPKEDNTYDPFQDEYSKFGESIDADSNFLD